MAFPPHGAQGNVVTKSIRPSWISMMPSEIKAGTALWGLMWGLFSPHTATTGPQGPGGPPAPAVRALSALDQLASAFRITLPTEALGPSGGERCRQRLQRTPPGPRRRRQGSVPIEFFQDCRVGVFKQPLLGRRRGVTGVHEDPVVTSTAVHATAADGVVQALVL